MERVKMNLTFNTLLGQLTSVKCNVWFPVSIFLHCRYQLKLVTAVSEVSRQSAHRLLVLQLCWCDLWTHWFEKKAVKMYMKLSATMQCELLLRSSNLISSSIQIPFPLDFFIHVLKITGIYCSTYINISPETS